MGSRSVAGRPHGRVGSLAGRSLIDHGRERLRGDGLLRSSLAIMSSTVLSSGLGYLYWLAASHLYTPKEVGLGSAIISAMVVTTIVSDLGVASALLERVPRTPSAPDRSRLLSAGLLVGGISTAVASAVVVVLLPLLSPRFDLLASSHTLALLFVAGAITTTLCHLVDFAFIAEGLAGRMLVRNAAFSALKLGLLLLTALAVRPSAAWLVATWMVASAVVTLVAFDLLRRCGRGYRPLLTGAVAVARALRRSLALHHLTNVGGLLPTYLLPIMVVTEVSASAGGYFYLTWMLAGVFFMVSPAVAASLFAEGGRHEGRLREQALRSFFIIGAVLVLPMSVALLAGDQLLGLFGPGYAGEGGLLLIILVVSAIPDAATNVAVAVLRVQGRLGTTAVINNTIGLVTLLASGALLPRLGIAATGWGWLGGQLAGLGLAAIALLRGRTTRPLDSLERQVDDAHPAGH